MPWARLVDFSAAIMADFEGAGLADGAATGGVYLLQQLVHPVRDTPSVTKVLTLGIDFEVESSSATDTFTIKFDDS
ncbi:hypothetical protein OK016_22630 [Vibrio chagasii]|nr:hypothetical protein [Vibrio chagasii]